MCTVGLAMPLHAQPLQTTKPTSHLLNIPLADGNQQRVLFVAAPHPKATIIMLPGGTGDVGLSRDGAIAHNDNFVVRTRNLWVARGYAVLIPDTVDHTNLRGLRSSPQYAHLVNQLIKLAHKQATAPVFLLGTSQGAIAAMNGAAHAKPGRLAGVILTESVSVMGNSHETVFTADPAGVRVPALVVANSDDKCNIAPPNMAPKIAAAMTNSPHVEVLIVSGGLNQSKQACGSLTPHGYDGIEEKVVGLISNWIENNLPK